MQYKILFCKKLKYVCLILTSEIINLFTSIYN